MPATPFRIDLTRTPAVVEVDGVDVAKAITGFELVGGFGEPTTLALHRNAEAGVVEGVAEVVVAGTGAVAAAAVRNLDPAEVRAKVDEALQFSSMAEDPLADVLEAIAGLLEGAP